MAEEAATSASGTARGTVERIEPTRAQRAAARRVAESKATAPHLYFAAEVRTASGAPERLVRAAALALRDFPRLNGAYRDGGFEIYSRINVGVVLEHGEAPVAPTIFDADRKGLDEIGAELRALAERARSGGLTSPDLAGGTFTVSATTSGGIRSLTPILNQGQAAALATGPVADRVLARDGTPVAEPALTATLACDARMVGAAEGAEFLDRVGALLEAPEGRA